MSSVIEIIKKRSSTRGYTSETLTDEELQTLIHAGLQAPTAANKQEVYFTVLKGDNPILLEIEEENYEYEIAIAFGHKAVTKGPHTYDADVQVTYL